MPKKNVICPFSPNISGKSMCLANRPLISYKNSIKSTNETFVTCLMNTPHHRRGIIQDPYTS